MKVILQQDIPNLGDAGDIKDVAPGYARNYLLPRNLVILANASSKKAMEHQKKLIKIKKEKRKKESEKLLEKMTGIEVTVIAQVGEEGKLFGSVTSMDIVKKLKEQNFVIDKRKIQLESPIKSIGVFDIPIKLDEGLTATVKLTVEGDKVVTKEEAVETVEPSETMETQETTEELNAADSTMEESSEVPAETPETNTESVDSPEEKA